jgi:hypothetical protein
VLRDRVVLDIQDIQFSNRDLSGMCPLNPLHQNLYVFLREEKLLYLTPHFTPPFPKDLSAIFEPTRRKPGPSPGPGKTYFKFRNKGCAIVRIWGQMIYYIIFPF